MSDLPEKPATGNAGSRPADAMAGTPPPRRGAGPLLLGVVGLIAGLIAGFAVDRIGAPFEVPAEIAELYSAQSVSAEDQKRIDEAESLVSRRHRALWFGLIGLILTSLFGLTEGYAHKSARSMAFGLIGGAVCGAGFGVLAGYAEAFAERRLEPLETETMFKTMAMHAVAWIVIGFGAGLIVGAQRGSWRAAVRSVLAAVAAAITAALLYPPLAAVLFPVRNSDLAIPEGTANRVFFTALAAALLGIALGRVRGHGPKSSVSSAPSSAPAA